MIRKSQWFKRRQRNNVIGTCMIVGLIAFTFWLIGYVLITNTPIRTACVIQLVDGSKTTWRTGRVIYNGQNLICRSDV